MKFNDASIPMKLAQNWASLQKYMSQSTTLETASKSRTNNLNAIRLIAAVLVIVDHAFPLEGVDHFLVSRLGFTLGFLAVATFFFLSGVLITQSWVSDPQPVRFVTKRFLRLMPGLAVALAVCAFIIGPIFTTGSIKSYFSSTQVYGFFVNNLLLYPQRYFLPGVFQSNPYPGAVNGSLWSLPLEVTAYFCVLLIGITRIINKRVLVLGLTIMLLIINMRFVPVGRGTTGLFLLMPKTELLMFLFLFALGSVVALYKDKIVLHNGVASLALVVCVLSFGTSQAIWGVNFGFTYALLTFGYQNWKICQIITKPGDLSYGIYIYAFPIQQIVAQGLQSKFDNTSPWLNFILSLGIVYPIAFASWHLVENPSLKLKRFFKPRKQNIDVAQTVRT